MKMEMEKMRQRRKIQEARLEVETFGHIWS
jgi:hypothetical protein